MQRRIPKYISYHFGLNYLSSKFLKGAHWQPISCCSMSAVRSLRFMQVALSFLVFSRAVAEGPEGALPRHLDDGVLQKVCSRADLASVCSKTIRIPTGATVSYKDACTTNVCTWSCGQKCTNNCCTWSEKSCTNKCCCWGFLKCGCSKNKCGEVCVNVPHFGCSKPKCGETCVDIPCSGASSQHCGETCVQVPDTLHIDWKDVSPCSHFTGLGTLLQTARATCSCLGGLSDFISSHVADYQQADPSVTALQAAANMVSCLVKEGFHMQSNKESVVNSLVSGNDYIIQASPVDLDLYLTLAGAVASCAVGGACQLIVTSLTDYFKTVAEEVGTGFNSFLDTSILQSVLEPLESAAELPQVFAEALPSSLSCLADSEQAAYLQLQTSVKELAHWFQELKKDVKTLREQGLQTKEAISKAINAVSGKVTTIVEELQEGKVPLLDSVKQISDLSEVQNFFSLPWAQCPAKQQRSGAKPLSWTLCRNRSEIWQIWVNSLIVSRTWRICLHSLSKSRILFKNSQSWSWIPTVCRPESSATSKNLTSSWSCLVRRWKGGRPLSWVRQCLLTCQSSTNVMSPWPCRCPTSTFPTFGSRMGPRSLLRFSTRLSAMGETYRLIHC